MQEITEADKKLYMNYEMPEHYNSQQQCHGQCSVSRVEAALTPLSPWTQKHRHT
jgi:hypothetical protein